MTEIFNEVSRNIEDGLNSVMNRPDIVVLNLLALIVLVFFVRKFLWQRVTEYLETRQNALTKALEDADRERNEAKKRQEQALADYEKMKAETTELKDKLIRDAYRQQEELIQSAKDEAKRRMEQAERDIEFEIERANERVKESIKEVAFAAARKIVKREIDEQMHEDIISDMTKDASA